MPISKVIGKTEGYPLPKNRGNYKVNSVRNYKVNYKVNFLAEITLPNTEKGMSLLWQRQLCKNLEQKY